MKKQQSDNIDEYVPCMNGNFERELSSLINKFSLENRSDTPDFILAKYMFSCLNAFNEATLHRTWWYRSDKDIDEELCDDPKDSDDE